jgi:uncharacterized membrane protein
MSQQRIIGLAFDTPEEAKEALETAMRLQAQDLLRVHEVTTLSWSDDGHVTATPPSPFAELAGDLQELARPGQTVLALLVSDVAGMAVIEELRRFRNRPVLYTKVLNHPGQLASMTR